MAVGALGFTPSRSVKVSADGPTYMRYFMMDKDETYGVWPSQSGQGTTTVKEVAALDNPLYIETTGENQYRISIIYQGTRYYAKAGSSNTSLDSKISNASIWSLTPLGSNHFNITSNNASYPYLGFKNKIVSGTPVRCFGTTSTNSNSDFNYTITLISVDNETSDLINAIKGVDCSTKNPTKDDWDEIGTAYNNISSTPVKNYLKVVAGDKNADENSLERAIAKYDYVCGKYKDSRGFDDFLDRDPDYPADGVSNYISDIGTNNHLTAVITVVSLITIASVTSLLFFKKKKQ